MDNLILIRAAVDLHRSLAGAFFRDVLQEAPHRFRLRLERAGDRFSVAISLRPELPWIGRPAGRPDRSKRPPGPFAALITKRLKGFPLDGVVKPTVDRVVVLEFADAGSLVAELATHGANLVLLDGEGKVVSSARNPKSARKRLAPGSDYRQPPLPRGKFDPFGASPEEIDRFVERMVHEGESPFEALRRHAFGVGTAGASMIIREASGATVGEVARRRLQQVAEGEADPVIDAEADPLVLAGEGGLDSETCQLLPWEPPHEPAPGRVRIRRRGPASTAGLYHEAVERAVWLQERVRGLRSVIGREHSRLEDIRLRVREDLASFRNPDRYRIQGEALLAGMKIARRVGDTVLVPDPYDAEGKLLEVPAPAGQPLASAAAECFARHRRAGRGLAAAQNRLETLQRRSGALARIERLLPEGRGFDLESIRNLEEGMRALGIPVGLEAKGRAARTPSGDPKPRLEGVRVIQGSEGQILVGRGGRHNDRLTFKLAAPDDFWFHALGVPGAHVVVRNPERKSRPPKRLLGEAAAVAAWYSEAREHAGAEVQWTRRKYVRRIRGAAPGRVTIKRFETVRVRPSLPEPDDPA